MKNAIFIATMIAIITMTGVTHAATKINPAPAKHRFCPSWGCGPAPFRKF